MTKSIAFSLALVAALLACGDSQAADVAYALGRGDVYQDSGDKYDAKDKYDSKGGKGGGGGGAVADVELNFMKFYQTDGVGPLGAPNRFQYEATPRITVGYVGAEGLGVRMRYWNYSYTAGTPGTHTAVDTYNLDAELFERIDVASNTSAEWSAGIRYNDFRQDEFALNQNDELGGVGLLFGLKMNRDLGRGSIYGRGRWAIMTDTDSNNLSVATADDLGMQTEIGLGYELSRCLNNGSLLTARVGYEYQYWSGYGVSSTGLGNGLTGVGFEGVVFGAGIER